MAAQDLILVVDDHEAGRYAKTRLLRQAGYVVLEAGLGSEALELVQAHTPRLLVLDVGLPDVNGWEVCRRIKADLRTRSVLVLQVSATFVQDADTVRALEDGADGCLTEPIEPAVLLATVRALLRAREAEDAMREALEREQAAREAAEAACAAAESANRTKDEFLATLSHELRSPLAALLNWSRILRTPNVGAEQRDRAIDAIERNARLQLQLIEDLLDVSRIISGRLRLEMRPVDLPALLREAVTTVSPAAEQKGVQLTTALDPAAGTVSGDPARLQQVTSNLLSNALKFTPAGGHVRVVLAREERHVRFEVVDDGRGIAPGFLPHVFEPFRQEDASSTRTDGGLGLGLAIARHLVHLHGGELEAESAGPGTGATFRVTLPRAQQEATSAPAGGPVPEAPDTPVLQGLRVLLVDDHADSRDGLSFLLGRAGAAITTVGSASEALDEVVRDTPDVLVSDLAMPDMDGYALIRAVRGLDATAARGVPAIALSAHVGKDVERRVRTAGFDACHAKPIDVDALAATIARVARGSRDS